MKKSLSFALLLFFSNLEASEANDLIKIYGSLRPEMIALFPEDGDRVRRMDDGYSRIGVKGTTELSEKLSGFYKYERRVSANDGEDDGAVRGDNNELRQVHAGLSGNLGSISIGRHYGLYYDYIDDELDRHRSHYSDAIVFGDLFVSNSLVYRSRSFKKFDFGVLVELNDADERGNAIDERLEIAGTFRHRQLSIHAGYVHSPFHNGLLGLASSYRYRSLNVAAIYQQIERANNSKEQLISLAVDAHLTSSNGVRLAVISKQNKKDADFDETYILLGGDNQFSEHFLVFAELFRKSTARTQPGDGSALIAGFRFDF
jgi:predicted porin